jgi:WD40 repeat protein
MPAMVSSSLPHTMNQLNQPQIPTGPMPDSRMDSDVTSCEIVIDPNIIRDDSIRAKKSLVEAIVRKRNQTSSMEELPQAKRSNAADINQSDPSEVTDSMSAEDGHVAIESSEISSFNPELTNASDIATQISSPYDVAEANGKVSICDSLSNAVYLQGIISQKVWRVAVSPQNNLAFACGTRGCALLTEPDFNIISKFNTRGACTCLCFYQNGRQLLIGSSTGYLSLFDLASQTQLKEVRPHLHEVNDIVVDEESGTVFTASSDSTLCRLDNQLSVRQRFLGHMNCVRTCLFVKKYGHLVSASFDNSVRVWSCSTSSLLYKLTHHSDSAMSLAFSPTFNRLVTGGSDSNIFVYDTPQYALLQQVSLPSAIASLGFVSGKMIVVAAVADLGVYRCNFESERVSFELIKSNETMSTCLVMMNCK